MAGQASDVVNRHAMADGLDVLSQIPRVATKCHPGVAHVVESFTPKAHDPGGFVFDFLAALGAFFHGLDWLGLD